MKKRLLMFCCSIALVLSACGGASNNTQTSTPETVEEADIQSDTEDANSEEAKGDEEQEKVENKEEETFSCVGAWSNEDGNNVFLLEEGGTGSLIQISTTTNSNGGSGSAKRTSSVTWEDQGDTVKIVSGLYGAYDYKKEKDGDQEYIKTEKVTYHRMSDEEAASLTENNNTQANNSEPISFDEDLVYEDKILKVALVQFSEQSNNKVVTFKVTNKSNDEFLFSIESAYIGEDEVSVVMLDGNSGPIAGKSKEFRYRISRNHNSEPLESMDELYDLDGQFRISVLVDDTVTDIYKADFSLKDMDLK